MARTEPQRTSWSGYVHPRALGHDGGDHDGALDIANDSNPNYLRWVAEMCSPFLGHRVMDLGAGYGAVTQHLTAGREVTALDASSECYEAMVRRFSGSVPPIRVIHGDLRELDLGEPFDSIVMINVLEHIEDDAGILSRLREHLKPGGTVVIYVPALNAYFTEWDRRVGHFRRYSKRRLKGVIQDAGLSLIHIRYANVFGLASWPFSGRVLGSGTRASGPLAMWDRYVTPLSRFLESHLPVPIGLNLLCVARTSRTATTPTLELPGTRAERAHVP